MLMVSGIYKDICDNVYTTFLKTGSFAFKWCSEEVVVADDENGGGSDDDDAVIILPGSSA